MNRKEYLKIELHDISRDYDSIVEKLRCLITYDSAFNLKDFEKAKKLMKKLVSLSSLYEKLHPEYESIVKTEREQILKYREEQTIIQRQKDDEEFEKMCNTPCPNPPIVISGKDFLEFVNKKLNK